ncbi:hypothetical protein RI844_07760 [Thalassotalea fonticola]|uniref:Thioredoxin domain-containing protein n=1 Tax=Thalassotalea fonticola TaxID=3065649 RepID=A0ABZ0GTW9_9GAMM|nr:hypothetical protein RI844_07760 [Colwelliaceae bacterium S1-1]
MITFSNKKLILVMLFLFISTLNSKAVWANETAFNADELAQIKQQHMGKKWLMLLWSVDCPPCFKELKLLKNMSQKHENLAIVIVNIDEQVTAAERQQIINEYQLQSLQHFYFLDGQSDINRYVIDPDWYGELPRSYFVDATGKFYGKSGLVGEELLNKWLIYSNNKMLITQHNSRH